MGTAVNTYVSTEIAFFDFDGTITRKDTLAEILKFIKGKFRYYLGLLCLSPVLVAFKLKFISNHKAKQILLTFYLKGMPVAEFNAMCKEFAETKLPLLFNKMALYEIRRHLQYNTRVVVISASAENWVKPWCDQYNIECIATKLQVVDDKLTGKIEGRNCHGVQKVRNILKNYNLSYYSKIYAYGDSRGDLPMLSLATDKFYRQFKEKYI